MYLATLKFLHKEKHFSENTAEQTVFRLNCLVIAKVAKNMYFTTKLNKVCLALLVFECSLILKSIK